MSRKPIFHSLNALSHRVFSGLGQLAISLTPFLLVMVLSFSAHAAPACAIVLLTKVKSVSDLTAFPSIMSVSQYKSDDLNSLGQLNYRSRDGKYAPDNAKGSNTLANSPVADLLGQQQEFALKALRKRLGYDDAKIQSLRTLGASLDHEQIVFLEMSRTIPQKIWNDSDLSRDPEYEVRGSTFIGQSFEDPNDQLEVKTATMWMVSGQALNPKNGDIVPKKQPWEFGEGKGVLSSLHLDRSKYRFVSEWGRAAQTLDGDFEPLFSSAAAIEYQRIRALGGHLEDGWVMFHSMRPANTRYYDRLFPHHRFPDGITAEDWNPNDALFIVPLSEIFQKCPPRKYLHRVSELVQLTDGLLSDDKALDFLADYKLLIWDEANIVSKNNVDQGQPLVIHDFSSGGFYKRFQLLEQYSIPKEKWNAVIHSLDEFRSSFANVNKGQYRDISDMNLYRQLSQNRSVELSNLSADLALSDPHFVKSALMSSYSFYIRRFFNFNITSPQQPQSLIHQLHTDNVHFAITTMDPEIAKQAAALQPEKVLTAPVPLNDPNRHPVGKNVYTPNATGTIYSYLFSIQQISDLISREMDFYNHSGGNAVSDGSWHQHYLLNSEDFF
jgi:hypothetical protein